MRRWEPRRSTRPDTHTAAAAALTVSLAMLTVSLAALSTVGPATAAVRGAGRAWTIRTVGGGVGGPGRATGIFIGNPCAVSYRDGHLYVATNMFASLAGGVRRIGARTDWLGTPLGTGINADTPDGTRADQASVGPSCGLAFDHHGNMLVSDGSYYSAGSTDGGNNKVRVVPATSGIFYGQRMKAGDLYTIAGTDSAGFSGDGGPATAATLNGPGGLAVDGSGNVIVADSDNDRLRVIAARSGTFYGIPMTAGDMYTVAGGGTQVANGVPATSARLSIVPVGNPKFDFSEPWPVVRVDRAGNIVLADTTACRVQVVAGRTGRFYGKQMTVGDIYTIAGTGRCGFSGDGGPATSAKFGYLGGLAIDHAGNVIVSDPQHERVRVIATSTGHFYGQKMLAGDVYNLAGDGQPGSAGDRGPAVRARLSGPTGITVDTAGNVVIADGQGPGPLSYYDNGRIQVVAARSGRFYGRQMTAGDVYTVAGNGDYPYSGDGGPATSAVIYANDNVTSRSGDLIFSDNSNRVRLIAARPGRVYGTRVRAGRIYTIAGNGSAVFGKYTGNRGPARRATLSIPGGVAVDRAGNLLIAVSGSNRVCVVAARSGRFYGQRMRAGHIYSIAGDGSFTASGDGGPATRAGVTPTALTVDPAGNLVIADGVNLQIRVVAERSGLFYGQRMKAGDIYTIAGKGGMGYTNGGPALDAEVDPLDVTVDRKGNILMADGFFDRIRVIAVRTSTFYGQAMKAEHIYTVAGDGSGAFSGDGGPALAAGLAPDGVTTDSAGNLVIADFGNSRVRVVAASTGEFYGQRMTAGDIYTVAGGGSGALGDGGPAAQAVLLGPAGVAVEPGGAILIADTYRIRLVSG
jgi:trimeric autotransporter adhesin